MKRSDYEYHCAAGESWDSVALEVYGDEKYAADLLAVNPALCGKIIFTGGERLRLPALEISQKGDVAYTPANAPWKN